MRIILEKHIGAIRNISWIECDGRDVLNAMEEVRREEKKAIAKEIFDELENIIPDMEKELGYSANLCIVLSDFWDLCVNKNLKKKYGVL